MALIPAQHNIFLTSVELLIPEEKYAQAGVRIGTKQSNKYLERRGFVQSVRPDRIRLFDIRKIDERIRVAAKMIARYNPEDVVAHTTRPYGFKPIQMMCRFIGCRAITGRFIPGTFTNPNLPNYMEPRLLFVVDPKLDAQAIKEAAEVGIPVIALVNTDSPIEFVDLMIPCNNKGRRSLALIMWLITRQVLRERGVLKPDEDLPVPPEEFEVKFAETAK